MFFSQADFFLISLSSVRNLQKIFLLIWNNFTDSLTKKSSFHKALAELVLRINSPPFNQTLSRRDTWIFRGNFQHSLEKSLFSFYFRVWLTKKTFLLFTANFFLLFYSCTFFSTLLQDIDPCHLIILYFVLLSLKIYKLSVFRYQLISATVFFDEVSSFFSFDDFQNFTGKVFTFFTSHFYSKF